MNTREFLEQDKERLKTRLGAAADAEEAAVICEDELNRILFRYNEQVPSDTMRKAASATLTTIRSALPLMDSSGEIRSYERTLSSGNNKAGGWAPLAVGIVLAAASAFYMTAVPAALAAVGFALMGGGLVGVFIGGLKFGKKRGFVPEKEQILEVHPDPEKIYHGLSGLLTVVDQHLEDVHFEELRDSELLGPVSGEPAALPEDELQLLAGILESAYARPESPDSQAMISNIRFYLHKKGVETLEYSEETARYFNKIPSSLKGTLRPAILQNNTVIVKGLTGGGI